jgi:hypothetical protein
MENNESNQVKTLWAGIGNYYGDVKLYIYPDGTYTLGIDTHVGLDDCRVSKEFAMAFLKEFEPKQAELNSSITLMEVSEKFDKIPDKRYNENMERQNLIHSLLAKAENRRLLAHGKNVVDMTFKNIDEYAFNDNLRMIEDRYKDDIATIDTLDIDIAEVESRFDNSTIG